MLDIERSVAEYEDDPLHGRFELALELALSVQRVRSKIFSESFSMVIESHARIYIRVDQAIARMSSCVTRIHF